MTHGGMFVLYRALQLLKKTKTTKFEIEEEEINAALKRVLILLD
jgi:hypothetical protein